MRQCSRGAFGIPSLYVERARVCYREILRTRSTFRLRLVSLALALIGASGAGAQDLQRVVSPDGQVELRLFIDKPDAASLFRLAYQVYFRGQRIINTSFLGLDVYNQVLLGENLGLISSKTGAGDGYHSLLAEYMQNGSLGRRINVEVRAFNGGVAFRYLVPVSTPLIKLTLENETTEFEFVEDAELPSRHQKVTSLRTDVTLPLPLVADEPGLGWVAIAEVPAGNYPRISLSRTEGKILISRLPPRPDKLYVAWEGPTPVVGPWRVVLLGTTQEEVTDLKLLDRLK